MGLHTWDVSSMIIGKDLYLGQNMHPCISGILKGMVRWLEELELPDPTCDPTYDHSRLISLSGTGLGQAWPG